MTFLHAPAQYTLTANVMLFLVFRFTSLKVLIFYPLLSKKICLCTAFGFAAFSRHNAIGRKKYTDFCQERPKSQHSCSLCPLEANFKCGCAAHEFSMT